MPTFLLKRDECDQHTHRILSLVYQCAIGGNWWIDLRVDHFGCTLPYRTFDG